VETASWILTIIALVGASLNAYQNKLCWPVWCCSNMGFIVVNMLRAQWPEVVLFSAFMGTAILGWRNHDGEGG